MEPSAEVRARRDTGVVAARVSDGDLYVRVGRPPDGIQSALEPLFELYERMLGAVEVPAVLRDVATVVCDDLGAERASVYLLDRTTNELESVAVIGNVVRTIRVPVRGDSLAGYCALTARAFVVPDAYGDLGNIDPALRFDRRWDEANGFRTRDVLCAPAVFKGDVIGVVQVINSRRAPFGARELAHLRAVSRLIGYALHHAKLHDDLATLKELEKRKAEFMRIMVHELKSPVSAAKMMADALQYHEAVANTAAAAVTVRIADRMAQLVDLIKDLLNLAQVKSGNPLGEITVFDLGAATRVACEQYHELAAQKGLTLVLELPDAPVRARFDAQGYRLVLSNLVSNAVKYTPAGGVTVTLRALDGWAVLAVADTGIGIPAKDVPRLFGEFFRASNAKALRIEGTGVGLAGAKSLVERFGGEFALETRENEGSTFTVRLPLCTE